MQWVWIIVGAFAGIVFADMGRETLGLCLGGALGYLLAQNRQNKKQLEEQAATIARLDPQAVETPAAPAQPTESSWSKTTDQASRADARASLSRAREDESAGIEASAPAAPAAPAEPNLFQKILEAAKVWLTTGNVPVKLGVVVSFFGVSFLLKYAVDQQMLAVPIEVRYAGVAAAAFAMLGIGWHLRERLRVYALSLLGGGIGVLFLTIFAAFRLHPLLPAPLAFALLVGLTAAAGVLAVVLNARGLAILGIAGGFLAPVLISTGAGNHVALFSYYLVLNAAVLGVAWYKSWRVLNLLGFFFTFGVAAAWGVRSYEPALLTSTQPFLVAFFLFYQGIAVLFALRQPPKLRGLVDGTLVFGTPVIAFAMQAEMVRHTEYGLAISALLTALFYVLAAIGLKRSGYASLRLLTESFSALAIAFATIAIPLALGDRWTAAAWALEGAALVWVGVRQDGLLARISGALLLFAGGAVFLDEGWLRDADMPVLNGNYLSAVLIAGAALFAARYLTNDPNPRRWQSLLAIPLLLWGLAFWGGAGIAEILDHGPRGLRRHLILGFLALSAWALARLATRLDWSAARFASLGYLPLLAPTALLYLLDGSHFFVGLGLLAWPVAIAAHFAVLQPFSAAASTVGRILARLWHGLGLLLFGLVLLIDVVMRMEQADFGTLWSWSAGLAALLALVGLSRALSTPSWLKIERWFSPGIEHWPFSRFGGSYLIAASVLSLGVLLVLGLLSLELPGDPAPLPFVPLLNPLDLLTAAGLLTAFRLLNTFRQNGAWLSEPQRWHVAATIMAITAFLFSTLAIVRSVFHLFDLTWNAAALLNAVQVQAALSVYWASLGFGAMLWGAKMGKRWTWLIGTGLMALVVLKLFVVDLGNTGTVARIVSFLAVGGLLLVVGYLAPAPPREALKPAEEAPSA
ncbi:MAG: DUF2339 domain-containing protein [Pseudomonadota bacterium]